MLKKRYLFLIILVCLFAISAVSAAEIGNDTNIVANDYDSSISESVNEDTLGVSLSNDEVQGSADNDTFTALQKKINEASEGSTINLENNYTYDEGFSNEGININKSLTIDGNGFTLDGKNNARIFYINANVTLKNINFINGYKYEENGGAIYWSGENGALLNCIFIGNRGYYGGAIYFNKNISTPNVSGKFINNTADCGGAIFLDSNVVNSSISGEFIGNNAKSQGGAISFFHTVSSSSVSGNFVNNTAYQGGAVACYGNVLNYRISGEFIGNNANSSAGAIAFLGTVSNSSISGEFIGNNASSGGGGAIYLWCPVYNSRIFGEFIDNVAAYYGGAILFQDANYQYMVSKSNVSGNFIGNIAGYSGGAIAFNSKCSNSSISGKFINNNASSGDGGAIFLRRVSNSDVVNSIFLGNNNQTIVCDEDIMANYNWFGNNETNYNTHPNVGRYVVLDSWLFLNASANPTTITINETSRINFKLNSYNNTLKEISEYDASKMNIQLNLSQTLGKLDKTTALIGKEILYTPKQCGNASVTGKFETASTTISITINPNVMIYAPDLTKYYKGSERFDVTIKYKDNTPVVGEEVKIYLNGQTYTKTTDNNGQVSMAINLNSGIYNVTTEYGGLNVNSTIIVKDTVIAKDFSKIYKNGTQYYGTFVDSQGNLIKNTDVKININGVFYTRTTDANGVAKMNINLNPGSYILTATNPLSGEMHTTNVTVLPSIVENYNLTKYYKNASKYTLKVLGNDGKPVGAGVVVTININGVFYERKTNATGYMNMNINLPPGTYTVTAEYNGLRASNKITVLSVLETRDLVMKYRDGSKFEAKVLDGQGNPYAGQTVTFNINGVFYTKTTEADGIARLKINLLAGEYIITSMYNGLNAANKVTIKS